jgi:hypothetical protein
MELWTCVAFKFLVLSKALTLVDDVPNPLTSSILFLLHFLFKMMGEKKP